METIEGETISYNTTYYSSAKSRRNIEDASHGVLSKEGRIDHNADIIMVAQCLASQKLLLPSST